MKQRVDSMIDPSIATAIAQLNYACVLNIYELELFRARLTRFQEQGGIGKPPALDNRGSSARLRVAVKSLASVYKRAKNNPKAVYYYGYGLALTGNALAVNMFDNLMTTYKKSKWTPDSYLALGEYYFDKQDVQKAMREYKVAMKSKKPVVRDYARYKVAWINFIKATQAKNLAQQRRAISDMTSIAKPAGRGKKSKKLAKIVKENLLDILVELNNLEEAKRILRRMNAQDVYASLLERMAFAKADAGDAKSAYRFFALAIKEDPLAAKNLLLSTNLVTLAAQLGNPPLVINNLKAMLNTYVAPKSKWRKKRKKRVRARAALQVENLVYEHATTFDRQGRDEAKAALLDGATQLYALFLKHFKKSKRFYEVQFYYGQALYQQQKYLTAAQMLLDMVKNNPKGKSTNEAAELMVTAAQIAVDEDKTKYNKPKPGQALRPAKIPPIQKNYADCLDTFVKLIPKNPNVPAMRYTSASVYYDWGHYNQAVKSYFKFIKSHPTNEFARPAAVRIFTYYQFWKNKKGLARAKKVIGKIGSLRNAPDILPFFAPAAKDSKTMKSQSASEIKEKNAKPSPAQTEQGSEQDEPKEI